MTLKAVSRHSTPCSTISSKRRQMKEPTPVHLHPPLLPWTTHIQPPLLALFLALVKIHTACFTHSTDTHTQCITSLSNTVLQLRMACPGFLNYLYHIYVQDDEMSVRGCDEEDKEEQPSYPVRQLRGPNATRCIRNAAIVVNH